jgi:hypothetical protein
VRATTATWPGVWLAFSACALPDNILAERENALIYGQDDRQELYTVFSEPALQPAAAAVAVMIPRGQLQSASDATVHVTAPTLAEAENLCHDEPFSGQPMAAVCTAVLIDDRLVASAGHCFARATACSDHSFVFGFSYDDPSQPNELSALTAYGCERVLVRANDLLATGPIRDFAIIELSDAVHDREPLALGQLPLLRDQTLTVIGASGGIPLKIDRGGRVLDARSPMADFFVLDSDTFYGGSGAPVLDERAQLVGLFARGHEDYELSAADGCKRVVHMPAGVQNAEQASYAAAAVAALCASGYRSARLCGSASNRAGPVACSLTRVAHADGSWIGVVLLCAVMLRARVRRRSSR